MDRRGFLKIAGISATGIAAGGLSRGHAADDAHGEDVHRDPGRLLRRPYGGDGVELSVIGLGGIVVMNAEQEHANRVVAEAVEKGVNYFDVAPTYGDAEVKLGPALSPYRSQSFLACKTTRRDRNGASEELERSLQRLKTDHLDLYQLHAITDVAEDVDAAFAKGGAMEVFVEAKKSQRVRYLGFSAHSEEAALAAMDRYDFDSILFPVNFACLMKGGFGESVIKAARKKGVTMLGLKPTALQKWPENAPERNTYGKCWYQPVANKRLMGLTLRWALSQPVTSVVPPGEESLFRMALDMAMDFTPVREADVLELRAAAEGLNPIFTA